MYRLNECVTPLSLVLPGSFTRASGAHAPLSSPFLRSSRPAFYRTRPLFLSLSYCDYQATEARKRWVQETVSDSPNGRVSNRLLNEPQRRFLRSFLKECGRWNNVKI